MILKDWPGSWSPSTYYLRHTSYFGQCEDAYIGKRIYGGMGGIVDRDSDLRISGLLSALWEGLPVLYNLSRTPGCVDR